MTKSLTADYCAGPERGAECGMSAPAAGVSRSILLTLQLGNLGLVMGHHIIEQAEQQKKDRTGTIVGLASLLHNP
jgi:hypothetical protein